MKVSTLTALAFVMLTSIVVATGCEMPTSALALQAYDIPVTLQTNIIMGGQPVTDLNAAVYANFGATPQSATWKLPQNTLVGAFANFSPSNAQAKFDIPIVDDGTWMLGQVASLSAKMQTTLKLHFLATEVKTCTNGCKFTDDQVYSRYADAVGAALENWVASTGTLVPTANRMTRYPLGIVLQAQNDQGGFVSIKLAPIAVRHNCSIDKSKIGFFADPKDQTATYVNFSKAIRCTLNLTLTSDPISDMICGSGPCPR